MYHDTSRDTAHARDTTWPRDTCNTARDTRDTSWARDVSECSTGDATPTSEGEGEGAESNNSNNTHPGGAVSLSAAISRISQPQVTIRNVSVL